MVRCIRIGIDLVIPWEEWGYSPDELRLLVFGLAEVELRRIYTKGLRLMRHHEGLQIELYLFLRP